MNLNEVRVIIPTKNEEATIGNLLSDLDKNGYSKITIIDGNSTDNTSKIVHEFQETHENIKFYTQSGKGKGQAVRQAIHDTNEPYILLLDADGTNPPEEGIKLLQELENGYEHVIGNRLNDFEPKAFKKLNLEGNKFFSEIFRCKTNHDMEDILSGFRAFNTQAIKKIPLTADGFEIETELCLATVKYGLKWKTVNTHYKARPKGSKSNLHPFKDGKKILDFLTCYSLK